MNCFCMFEERKEIAMNAFWGVCVCVHVLEFDAIHRDFINL